MSITKMPFGHTAEGQAVELYTLENKNGMRLAVTTYGAKLVQLWAPDRDGKLADVITGFDTLDPYLIRNPYFGALVGRCANRIANAQFELNGKTIKLDCNRPPHHLHGGQGGFDKQVFGAEALEKEDRDTLILTHLSPDGDQGYPGNLTFTAEYSLTDANEVVLHYYATTDADTVVNITNHSYFNLAGHDFGHILDHVISIDADAFTPTMPGGVPTGEIRPVEGTAMDLRTPVRIGDRIHADYPQLQQDEGFDINYCLNGQGLRPVCRVTDPGSGRTMEVRTTLPGMQFYTANFIKGDFVFHGKGGYLYGEKRHCALCLETQFHPNTPNTPAFGDITLHPGDTYDETTVYAFGTDRET